MKPSVLSKALGLSIISLNLALLPVSAQTGTTPGNSTTGSNATSNPNIGASPAPSNGTTGSSMAPSSSTSGSSTAPSDANASNNNAPSSSTSGNSTTPGAANTGNSNASSGSPSGASTAPGAATTDNSTTSSSETTSTKSGGFDWGWLGLIGLLGLASLFYRSQRSSVVARTGYEPLHASSESTGDRLQQGFDQAQVGAHGLWDQLKTGVDDFKERRAQEKEIKGIKNALGRPSKRVILDKQDNLILNVGDLVTHQAIERARHADMLDVLLDSVDEQEPEIANEERSAPIAGEASLEEQETTTNRHQH